MMGSPPFGYDSGECGKPSGEPMTWFGCAVFALLVAVVASSIGFIVYGVTK